jgi:hypothetical protein
VVAENRHAGDEAALVQSHGKRRSGAIVPVPP